VILEGMASGEADSVLTRRLQAINGDFRRGNINLDCIGLIAPVEEPAWADIRGFEGSPEDNLP
jgi:hypothetical protein